MRLISRASKLMYQCAIKPLLFRYHPDAVHTGLLRFGRFWQRFGFTRVLVRSMWSYEDEETLGQKIQGVYFPNPVGLAAGFDKNVELVPTMKAVGFGFMTGGSITFHPCAGNPRPWFYRLPKQRSLVVNAGLANEGVEPVRRRLRSYHSSTLQSFPLIISVAKTNNPETCTDTEAVADYIGSLTLLKNDPHASILELNISCPNAYGGEPFTDAKRLDTLLAAVDALALDKPVWVKMPINHTWEAFDALLKVIVKHQVRGVTIGNLKKDRGEIPSADLPNEVNGNLSGLPTQALSDELISHTYKAYGDKLTIVGVGGIFTAEDAYRKICLGASLVELITGMIYEGPQLIGQINRELAELLHQNGFSNVSDAIGSTHITSK